MREMIACAVCLLAIVFVVALSFVFAARHNVAAQPGSVESPPPSVHAPQAPIPASPDLGLAPRPNVGQSEQRAATPDSESVAYGRIVYGRNGCATCHSIGGEGNPRYRLDGCGDRWDASALRAWVTGTGLATELLSDGMRRRKSLYASLPAADLEALVLYLATLKQSER